MLVSRRCDKTVYVKRLHVVKARRRCYRVGDAVFSSDRAGGFLGMVGCKPPASPRLEGIILVVADGTSLEVATRQPRLCHRGDGKAGRGRVGLFCAGARTSSRSRLRTSAGGGHGIGPRIKADNTVLGMAGALDQTGLPSILDLAKKAGWSTGAISDDAVTGATPSAF